MDPAASSSGSGGGGAGAGSAAGGEDDITIPRAAMNKVSSGLRVGAVFQYYLFLIFSDPRSEGLKALAHACAEFHTNPQSRSYFFHTCFAIYQ